MKKYLIILCIFLIGCGNIVDSDKRKGLEVLEKWQNDIKNGNLEYLQCTRCASVPVEGQLKTEHQCNNTELPSAMVQEFTKVLNSTKIVDYVQNEYNQSYEPYYMSNQPVGVFPPSHIKLKINGEKEYSLDLVEKGLNYSLWEFRTEHLFTYGSKHYTAFKKALPEFCEPPAIKPALKK